MSQDDFRKGATLDGAYTILETVGTGGMGTVVKAERSAEEQVVALKYC